MRRLLVVLLLAIAGKSYCQHQLPIIICDSANHSALCYASVANISTASGAISNNEGKCLIPYSTKKDSIIISYVGYSAVKCRLEILTGIDTVFLAQEYIWLNTITILPDVSQHDLANQLYEILEYNKLSSTDFHSKANLVLKSFIDSVPLERIESVGNLYTSKGGVADYVHQMGRVGQNHDNNFFTLSVVSLLNNFQLYNPSSHKIPLLITQQNKSKINDSYNLSRIRISEKYSKITFNSKTGNLFSGYVVFDSNKQIVNFHFTISGAINQFLKPIFANHSISIQSMEYEIKYTEQSEQTSQPDYIKLKYDFIYDYGNEAKNHITSEVIISITGSKSQFLSPIYCPNNAKHLTDYQQIIILPFDSTFWHQNFICAQNLDDSLSLNYFKKYGYATNFQSYNNDPTLKTLLNGVYKWNGNQNISFADFNNNYESNGIKKENLKDVHEQYFNDELFNLEIGYMIIPKQITTDSSVYEVIPYFNSLNSYYFLKQDFYSQIAVNLYFDIFEKNRTDLVNALKKAKNIQDAKNISELAYRNTKAEADLLFKQCSKGALLKPLLYWTQSIDSVMNTNRTSLAISDYLAKTTSIKDPDNNQLFDFLYAIGCTYLEMNEADVSLKYLRSALLFQKTIPKNKIGQLYYNMGVAYSSIGETDKACLQYKNAALLGVKKAMIFIKKHCE